jgi:hypothetical protein
VKADCERRQRIVRHQGEAAQAHTSGTRKAACPCQLVPLALPDRQAAVLQESPDLRGREAASRLINHLYVLPLILFHSSGMYLQNPPRPAGQVREAAHYKTVGSGLCSNKNVLQNV